MTSIKNGSGTERGSFAYDVVGNQTSKAGNDGQAYDAANQLKYYSRNSVDEWYVYDASGQRVKKITHRGTYKQYMTYIDGVFTFTRIDEPGQDGGKQTVYIDINGPDGALAEYRVGDQIFQRDSNIRVIYILKDHLGSCGHKLFENNGLWRYEETTPFGQTVMSGYGQNTQQKKFVGKEQDESGLYYYGARYYDAWQCRFVSVDPLWREYPYYTPYQYAGNKPINYIDVEGLQEGQSAPQQEQSASDNLSGDGGGEPRTDIDGGASDPELQNADFSGAEWTPDGQWSSGGNPTTKKLENTIISSGPTQSATRSRGGQSSGRRSSSSVAAGGAAYGGTGGDQNIGGAGGGNGQTPYGRGGQSQGNGGGGAGGGTTPGGQGDAAGGGISARNTDFLSSIQPISPGPIAERVPLEIQAPDLIDGPSDPRVVPPGISIYLGTIGLWTGIAENSIRDPYGWNKRITPTERAAFKNSARPFRFLGRGAGTLAIVFDVFNLVENYRAGDSRGVLKSSINAAVGVIALFGGPAGWAGAVLFGIADATGLVDGFINLFY